MSVEKISKEPHDEVAGGVSDISEGTEASVTNEAGLEEELVDDLSQKLAKAHEELAEVHDKMLRAAAENENFKKRMERERLINLKYAGEAIFREFLPVVDNLERAVDQSVIEGVDSKKNFDALLEGVQLTLNSLFNILEKFEVKALETIGKPFDPKDQEALTIDESDTIPAKYVISEFEKGYYYKDRLLRAAKVIVSSGEKEIETGSGKS